MKRVINWKDAFWLTAGILPAILLSIAPIAAIIGTPSILVWILSTLIGFVQLFLYAELGGIFPNKTGGASLYGAVAWLHYGKIFAPINVWSYWLSWSLAIAVTAAVAGNYLIYVFFANTPLATFSITLLDLSALLPGIAFKLDGPILCSTAILLLAFYFQHRGLLRTARVQFALAILSVIPLLLLAVVPLLIGKVNLANFVPLIPQGTTSWLSAAAFTLMMGGMFIAAYTTYAAEIAVCYMSEFKDPAKDGVRALVLVGAVSAVCCILLPFTFLGVLGMQNLTAPDVATGNSLAPFLKLSEISFGVVSGKLVTLMLLIGMLVGVITAMASSSRTLYQASLDGLFPKYLEKLNKHGMPTRAMWTDLIFNLVALSLGNPIFLLAAANVAYVLCICMDLNAVWMLRKQRPNQPRNFRAPNWLVYWGAPALTVLNLAFVFFGANVFAPNALWYALLAIAIIIPVFCYRHYVADRGVWPETARRDLEI